MNDINKVIQFFSSLKIDIPLYISLIIIGIIICILVKKMTKPFSFILLFLCDSIVCLISKNSIVTLVIAFIIFIPVIIINLKVEDLDFRKTVFSISMIYNIFERKPNDDSKIIGTVFPYNKFQLKYNKKRIKFGNVAAKGGVLITGSTGSGKTYGMKSLMYQDIKNGHSIVFFDYKGEQKIIDEIKGYGKKLGIEVFEMSNHNINFNYDPLSSLNITGRVEALLNTRKWSMDGSDAHYRMSTQLLLQKLLNEFETIWDHKSNYMINFYDFIKKYNYDRSMYDAYTTVLKMLELLLTSNISSVWKGENEKNFSFNIKEQYIVIFSFISGNKELANSVSSFAYKDLLDTGTNNAYDKELCLYVDEFGTLENSLIIKDILEKGRSCGIQTILSLQDVNQIVINTSQAYLNSILGTMNTFIIYSGATKATAEIMSGVQIYEIDKILLSLRKPYRGQIPTCMYISKYPSLETDKAMDVFKIYPYIVKGMNLSSSDNVIIKEIKIKNDRQIFKEEIKPIMQDINIKEIEIKEEKEIKKPNYDNLI